MIYSKKILSSFLIFLLTQGFLWVDISQKNYSLQGLEANALTSKKKVQKGRLSQTGAKMRSVSKNYTTSKIILADVEIASGTIISERSGDLGAVDTFLANPKSVVSLKDEVFKLGYDNKYLTFSKPVKLSFTTQFKKGEKVRPLVQHFGDEKYNTVGLTTNPNAVCDDGKVVGETFDTVSVQKKGLVEFYTCGASRFIMNPAGGTTISNDLRVIVGDCGQVQIYYKGLQNIYVNDPPATGCGGPSAWLRMKIGGTTYGNGGTAWTTQNTVGSTDGNTYTATSSMTAVVGGLTYALTINWTYIAPNTSFTWRYNVNIPAGNTQNVKLYYGMDSYVAGGDANDVGYFSTGPTITAGVYDNVANVLSAMRYLTGLTWAGYEAAGYNTINTRITSGDDFNNTIIGTAGDLGYGINWNFGTGTTGNFTSTTEWRMAPYVATPVADLVAAVGQPNPAMQVNVQSQLPVVVTNVGNTGSTGTHTVRLILPNQISGPGTAFSNNGWSCSATVSQVITCTRTMILPSLGTGSVEVPVIPLPSASGLTLPFTGGIQNASDSNNTNNTGVTNLFISVAPAPVDNVAPIVSYTGSFSGGLLPNGNFTLGIVYTNTGTAINTASGDVLQIQKWNGSSWGANIATGNVNFTGKTINNSGASYPVSGLSFGRYLVTHSIRDLAGNRGTGTTIFSIDEPSITISTGAIDIGNITSGSNFFSVQEIIITIQTVGAAFTLSSEQNSDFETIFGDTIAKWDGTQGFGYDDFPYSSTLSTFTTGGVLLANQTQSINPNGLKNTYTYRIKGGVRFNFWEQIAGDYETNLGFTTIFNY